MDDPDKYRALSVALVLNPLAAGLAGVCAVVWLIGWVLRVRVIAVVSHNGRKTHTTSGEGASLHTFS